MSRKKPQFVPLSPWETNVDGNGKEKRYIRLSVSLFFSPSYKSLSPAARHLYSCMDMEAGGKRVFEFPRGAMIKYGFSESSARRYIKELEKRGFIKMVASGKPSRQSNLYEFVFTWKEADAEQKYQRISARSKTNN